MRKLAVFLCARVPQLVVDKTQMQALSSGAPAAGDNCSASIRIFIECQNLIDKDTFSKSDPFVVVKMKNSNAPAFVEVGRTEVKMNNLSPKFSKFFDVIWHFEIRQDLEFFVYDFDGGVAVDRCNLDAQDFLGCARTQLAGVIGSPGRQLIMPLEINSRAHPRSKIVIRAEQLGGSSGTFLASVQVRGVKLAKKDWFGKSDPYLQFCRARPDGTFDTVHQTEIVKNTLDPVWRPFQLKNILLGSNDDAMFRINVIDWDANTSHDHIGHILISFKQFMEAVEKKQPLKILHYKGKAKDVGTLDFNGTSFQKLPTFMDFLQGGLQMKMFVAIDFTGSNGVLPSAINAPALCNAAAGDPRTPTSLHFMRPGAFNEYQPPPIISTPRLRFKHRCVQVSASHRVRWRDSGQLRQFAAVCLLWLRRCRQSRHQPLLRSQRQPLQSRGGWGAGNAYRLSQLFFTSITKCFTPNRACLTRTRRRCSTWAYLARPTFLP